MHPLSFYFLNFYASHPSELVGWHSFVSRAGSVLFKAFSAFYKNFKEKFFKMFVEPAGTHYFFDEVSQPRFPLFWTRSPSKIKNWPRPVNPSKGEQEVFTLFDSLPKNLPARPLMSLYIETNREATFEGMFDILVFRSFTLCF